MTNLYSFTMPLMLLQFPLVALETSIISCYYGVPFGGTAGWILVIVMSNDSGDAPWVPWMAAFFGLPITLVLDVVLFLPALIVMMRRCS